MNHSGYSNLHDKENNPHTKEGQYTHHHHRPFQTTPLKNSKKTKDTVDLLDLLDCAGEKRIAVLHNANGDSIGRSSIQSLFSPLRAQSKSRLLTARVARVAPLLNSMSSTSTSTRPKSAATTTHTSTTKSTTTAASTAAAATTPTTTNLGKRSFEESISSSSSSLSSSRTKSEIAIQDKRRRRNKKNAAEKLIASVLAVKVEQPLVFDSCPQVVRKIKNFIAREGVSQTIFLRAIGVHGNSLNSFIMGHGQAQCANNTYVCAFMFFEKLRIYEHEPKSEERLTNEKKFPNGFSLTKKATHAGVTNNKTKGTPLKENKGVKFVLVGSPQWC